MTMNKIFSSRLETRLSYRSLTRLRFAALVFVAVAAAGPSALIAQGSDTQPQGRANPIMGVPAPLGGTAPQLAPSGEGESLNILRGGLTVGALYSDNSVPVSGQRTEYQYSVMPSLG